MNNEQLWWYPLLDCTKDGKPSAATIEAIKEIVAQAYFKGWEAALGEAETVMKKSLEGLDLSAEIELAVNEGQKIAYKAMKQSIESSHMSVCGDPKTAQDVAASIKMFKFQLMCSIDGRIAKLEKV